MKNLIESDVSYFKLTHSNTDYCLILNGPSHLFSLSHDVLLPVFYLTLCQYMVTWSSFCAVATPCLERSSRHKEEVRVYLFSSLHSQVSCLLMIIISLLYSFTCSLLRLFTAHVVQPEGGTNTIHQVNKVGRMFKRVKRHCSCTFDFAQSVFVTFLLMFLLYA